MHPDDYQRESLRTEYTPDFVNLGQGKEHDMVVARLIHAMLGLASETGEIADALKKHIMYKRELDVVNLMEEIGDLAWYEALMLSACKKTFSEALEKNILKLKLRFPDKFTFDAVNNRNLDGERAVLEGK